MKHYLEDNEKVISYLNSKKDGLSPKEASERLEANGRNKLIEGKKKSIFERVISQIADPMVLVLIGAAIVSFITFCCCDKYRSRSFSGKQSGKSNRCS